MIFGEFGDDFFVVFVMGWHPTQVGLRNVGDDVPASYSKKKSTAAMKETLVVDGIGDEKLPSSIGIVSN